MGPDSTKLIDPVKYEADIKAIDEKIIRFENELKRKITARNRLYDLIEDDSFDKNELKRRLNLNQDLLLGLGSQISEAQSERKDLQEAKDNDHLLRDFLKNKKGVLQKLARDLVNLPPEDRKTFVESMVDSKFAISSYGREYGKLTWEMKAPKIKFNLSILREFMDQGKIGKLDKNSSYSFTGMQAGPSP